MSSIVNFLFEGLVGFDLCGKVCGIVGPGRIGAVVARILHGFGCQLLGFDLRPNDALVRELRVRYTEVETIYWEADIITLHSRPRRRVII